MRAQITLGAVALGLLLAGCGQRTSERQAVAAYLKHVNKIESALAKPLATVTTTGSQFTNVQREGGSLTSLVYDSQVQALRGASSRIQTLRAQLAALRAPVPANHLRALLLQVVDLQTELTTQLEKLVEFLPRFIAALAPIPAATKKLETVLLRQTAYGSSGVATVYAAKAIALRQFKAVLDRVVGRLRRLDPPEVSKPDYQGEIASLEGMSSTAGQLAVALAAGPTGNVQQLLVRFNRAATSNQTIAAQKARIAAVRAYDRQSARLDKLTREAELERSRLANTLS